MNKTIFKGTCTAAITPFVGDQIDYRALVRIIEYQISGGVDAICFLGTTGEAPTVTDEEYEKIVTTAVETINGRVKVIVGCGANCTDKAIRKVKLAQKHGADGLLAVTPYYNKCTQKGLTLYYNALCDCAHIPVICYNVPSRTGVSILPETMSAIAEHPNIAGLKEASENVADVRASARAIENKTALYCGNDALISYTLSVGAQGVFSVASNVAPRLISSIVQKYFDGDLKTATDLQNKALPLIDALFAEVNPIPVKYAAHLLGLCENSLRPPLTAIEKNHAVLLKKTLNDLSKELLCEF